MDEAGLLPAKRTKSSSSFRSDSQQQHRSGRKSKAPSSSPTSPLANTSVSRRPPVSRTASAPLVPQIGSSSNSSSSNSNSKDPRFLVLDDSEAHGQRDSITSIKDDPFFRNYQSPQSLSLARELRSATISELEARRDEDVPEPPPRSKRRPSIDNSVKLPVRHSSCENSLIGWLADPSVFI